jgi:hypothetical protein
MQPGQLYQARCLDGDDCLAPALPVALKKGATHRFLYRTNATPVQNSLVVIQLKYVGVSPQSKASRVALSRQAINFGCNKRSQNYVYPAIAALPEQLNSAPKVSYENYDQFYRYGYSGSEDQPTFWDFNVRRYFNGATCVRTADPERAGQFLFEKRDDVAGWFRTAWRKSGAQEAIGPALAQPGNEILRYQDLHVYLANYQKRPDATGCFSFPLQGKGSSVEVAVSDVEENVRARTFGQHSWVFSVY